MRAQSANGWSLLEPAWIKPNERINTMPVNNTEWPRFLRSLERKRQLLIRGNPQRPHSLPASYFVEATYSSFRQEGIDLHPTEVSSALVHGKNHHALRSRIAQRIRNHAAILHTIENSIRLGESLKMSDVTRWYTSLGTGLINTSLPDGTMNRLDMVVRRISAPQLRLQQALSDIARLYVQLQIDPLFPSFNGMIARFILRYHLGKSGLPPVVLNPETDPPRALDEAMFLSRMLHLLEQSHDILLNDSANQPA